MSDITLKSAERDFITTQETLAKSRNLSGPLLVEGDHARTGHPYQLKRTDRDGDTFEHILRYVRTNKAPLFYDPVTKFDDILYDRLRTESEFYGCQELTDYLRAKSYRDAVKVTQYVETINDYEEKISKAHPFHPPSEKGCSVELIPHWTSLKYYDCPADKAGHMDQRTKCSCNGAHTQKTLSTLCPIAVYTNVIFRPDALVVHKAK